MEGILTVLTVSFVSGFIGGALAVSIIAKDLLSELRCCIREVMHLREEIMIYRCLYRASSKEIDKAMKEAKEHSNLVK